MTRHLPPIALLAALACQPPALAPADAGGDPGQEVTLEQFPITVSGSALLHPAARSEPFDWIGLTVQVEEPLKIALGDDRAVLGSAQLEDGGTFSISGVAASELNVALALGVLDPNDLADGGACDPACGARRVVRASTVLWDMGVAGEKPRLDIPNARAYAVPVELHDRLTQAVMPSLIRQLTGGVHATLSGAGFVLGRIVDAEGAPVEGVTLAPVPETLRSRVFYPTDDLTSTRSSTSPSGLFVYLHDGGEPRVFSLSVEGRPEYPSRRAVGAPGLGLVLIVEPGQAQR